MSTLGLVFTLTLIFIA